MYLLVSWVNEMLRMQQALLKREGRELRLQSSDLQLKGLTLLWMCLCCLRPDEVANVFPHSGQVWARAPTCWERIWRWRLLGSVNTWKRHTEINHMKWIYIYACIFSHCNWSVIVSNFIEYKPSEYLKQIEPVCPVHNLRAGYAVPYHSFHTQSVCHCHVTSGDEWGWTSSWRLSDIGHTYIPSPLCGLSCVAPGLISRTQACYCVSSDK